MRTYEIGALDQIPRGEGRNFDVDGKVIAVFHTQSGAVFATQPRCPHLGGPLADGLTGGTSVICPLHDRTYDLQTGRGLNTGCSIAVYPTHLTQDGTVVLELDADRFETAGQPVGAGALIE